MIRFEIEYQPEEGQPALQIKSDQCLVKKDGGANIGCIKNLKEVFGWDGVDPYWLEEAGNIGNTPIEIVIDWNTFTGNDGKEHSNEQVKWINSPGGSQAVERLDPKVFAAKFGSKLRAAAGGVPATKPADKAPTPAPAAKGPPARKGPPTKSAAAVSNAEEVWKECLKVCRDDQEQAKKCWEQALDEAGITDRDPTPEEWFKIKDSLPISYPDDKMPPD